MSAATPTPVRVRVQRLPVLASGDPVVDARARKRAAAMLTANHLRSLIPDFDPATLQRGRHGKPFLPPPHAHIGFNPSDSGGWYLFGWVDGAELGVDLEWRQPRPKALAVAERHFRADEVAWLREQADVDHAFLRLWTLKEAMVKAIGRGLGYGLGKPAFAPGRDGRLALVDLLGEAGPATRWQVAELDLGERLVGAAVWSGAARPLVIEDMPDV